MWLIQSILIKFLFFKENLVSMSKRDISNTNRLPILPTSQIFPGLPSPSNIPTYEQTELMLRCKLCNQIVSVNKAYEHQAMHKDKGEDPCFTIESVQISNKRSIWYSNEII